MSNGMYISQNSAVKRAAELWKWWGYSLMLLGLRQYARKSCGDAQKKARSRRETGDKPGRGLYC